MKKVFLISALLFTCLSYAQDDSASKSLNETLNQNSNENSFINRRYPVFPADSVWPEKSSAVPIFILLLAGITILTLIIFIIRKSKGKRNRIIIGGFSEDEIRGMVRRSIPSPYNIGSSGIYSKRKGGRGGYRKRDSSTGGFSGSLSGGFGGGR